MSTKGTLWTVVTGKGVIRWANGDVYEGLVDGKRTGKEYIVGLVAMSTRTLRTVSAQEGSISLADGDVYEGEFIEGKITRRRGC